MLLYGLLASRRYCSFIISNLLNNRPIQYVLFDYHVDISNKIYHHSKHLDLLTKTLNIPNVNYDNTIIIDNNSTIANDTLPYKTYCCKSFNIIKYINSFEQDHELNNIITHLSTTFGTPNSINTHNPTNPTNSTNPTNTGFNKEIIKQSDFVKQNIQQERMNRKEEKREDKREEKREDKREEKKEDNDKSKHELLGWKRVESRSRPGEFSYENIYTGERIPDEPK